MKKKEVKKQAEGIKSIDTITISIVNFNDGSGKTSATYTCKKELVGTTFFDLLNALKQHATVIHRLQH